MNTRHWTVTVTAEQPGYPDLTATYEVEAKTERGAEDRAGTMHAMAGRLRGTEDLLRFAIVAKD